MMPSFAGRGDPRSQLFREALTAVRIDWAKGQFDPTPLVDRPGVICGCHNSHARRLPRSQLQSKKSKKKKRTSSTGMTPENKQPKSQ